MKISENWLREWVNPEITTDELVEQLTMLGLEVDEVMPAAGEFTHVVVAEIVAIEKHPDADKLNVCQVDVGHSEKLQIVCGAPNVRVGLKAPLAMIGAVLPGDFHIKKSKLRGLESNGMLCSNVELGFSEDHSGLLELPTDAPVGQDIRKYFELNDSIIDIDLTPNRADCFCVKGIAIDVACLNKLEVNQPTIGSIDSCIDETIAVNLQAKKQCPRYISRVINNIDSSKQTPQWMQEKLRRSGIRAIHPVVDVTNYVMLELGQPMHGFDKSSISGSINVKMASNGDKFTLLDGKEVSLDESYLMIADDNNYLAIAGVMGGLDSGCNDSTKDIVLESAYFDPATIMGKSRDLGIQTESALRFERGVDPYLQEQAMQRATQLILDICGGEVGPLNTVSADDFIPKPNKINLTEDKLLRVLGFKVTTEQVTTILKGLGMDVKQQDNIWQVIAPSSRFDISIEEDLIEEVVRMVGYDKMPSENLMGESVIIQLPEEIISNQLIKTQMTTIGYQEAINYSFVSAKQLDNFNLSKGSIALKNPLTEELAVMRTSLLPGMIQCVKYNLRRQNESIKLFETGYVFNQQESIQQESIQQENKIIAICTGKRHIEHWSLGKESIDYFDCKGDLEVLLDNCKKSYSFVSSTLDFLHPGRQASVVINGQVIGWIGQIHPEICRRISIKKEVYAFELYIKSIQKTVLPCFQNVSKYPSVRRDLALIIDNNIKSDKITQLMAKELGESLVETIIFDEYQGDNIESGKRSLAVGFVLQQQNTTFEDKEVDKLMSKVVSSLKENLNVEIRGY
ncbi:MAG: phenylalanine--tRNA ligase subunit beta [Proteobacteria bacterium]|nr:phenylalanine--tRNA ligase subunit beta [Pseudomonadota bacterium]